MRNAAGTENRFPYTVMEAVLGLNSYLQDQFSALADIYMPIEGITESKTGQEFVYRKSPATIKAKSLTLDRIYGKTLAWNSLVQNGNFASTDNWTAKSAGFSVSSGVASITFSTAGDCGVVQLLGGAERYNHKILVRYTVTAITGTWKIGVFRGNTSNPLNSAGLTEDISATGYHCAIITLSTALDTSTNTGYYFGFGRASAVGNTLSVKNVTACDLTLLYGSEIDGMTDEQILAKFEREFPGYHDFGNKLISNDAESLETVGFNLWDEEWESGKYSLGEGIKVVDDTCIRSKNAIPCFPSTQYYFKGATTNCYFIFFANDGSYLGESTRIVLGADGVFTTPSNAAYLRFWRTSSTTYNHDICISLSDPAKNGTYEPYRKTTLQLNLGSFQVRDSQGNVTTITGGLKSAGSVRDEIVGNKYIKRVGSVDLGTLEWGYLSSWDMPFTTPIPSDCKNYTSVSDANLVCSKYSTYNTGTILDKSVTIQSNKVRVKDTAYSDAATFKTAMSGVMLYYELATPVEYELVEPLVYSMAAGTTEERISPNSDGLSAPFCCDMTYDANANNDSANAQYALAAGRLYNTHKLWGQDFDGSQDVAGSLTGVTDLNSLIYLSEGNVGIGQSSPSYKLDVSGTLRATGNATIGGTLNAATLYENGIEIGPVISAGLQSLQSQIDSVATKDCFDNLNAQALFADVASIATLYAGPTTITGAMGVTGAASLGSTLSVAGLLTAISGVKVTTTKKIWFGDTYYIELDSNNRLHTNAPIISDSYITAGAANS